MTCIFSGDGNVIDEFTIRRYLRPNDNTAIFRNVNDATGVSAVNRILNTFWYDAKN